MRVLVVTNQVKTYNLGFQNLIGPLLELGHEVIWAANFERFAGDKSEIPCQWRHIDIQRNPAAAANVRAYRRLRALIEKERIEAIYCSTPIGGLLGRLAGHRKKVRKIIYAAHGFAFYHGAPWWWNLTFRTEEKILARITDVLITINDEDMEAAQSFRLRGNGHVYQIGGAGIEESYTVNKSREQMRGELNIPSDAVVLVSAGALNKNKNFGTAIAAVAALKDERLYYLICGDGPLKTDLQQSIKKTGMENHILLLGFRTDMQDIMGCADIYISSSFREGVPRATLEAMALGLPCVVSDARGNRDLIENGKNGIICEPKDTRQYSDAILRLAEDSALRKEMGLHNAGGGTAPIYIIGRVPAASRYICRRAWQGERR